MKHIEIKTEVGETFVVHTEALILTVDRDGNKFFTFLGMTSGGWRITEEEFERVKKILTGGQNDTGNTN